MIASGYIPHHLYTLILSTSASGFGNLLQLQPTTTIKYLETEYLLFQISTDSETSKYIYILYSHLERMGKLILSLNQEYPGLSFFFWPIFFPYSCLILWDKGSKSPRGINSVFINLTQQGENDHADLVSHEALWNNKGTYPHHWKCCLSYITLSPFQA